MHQFPNYADKRNQGWCVFCGGAMETRDHVPSCVFLDEPYPENLPVVASCRDCNQSFSLDEEYLACLIDCVKHGTVDLPSTSRSKVVDILARKRVLASRIASARRETHGDIKWMPESERVRNVVVKLARGHIAFEMNEPRIDEPCSVSIVPLCTMEHIDREMFESSPDSGIWPEVGSRAMHRVTVGAEGEYAWIEVQPERYRYLVSASTFMVRVVIGEYLAGEVVWG